MNHGNLPIGKLSVGVLGIVAILFGVVATAHAACSGDPKRSIAYSGPANITVPRDVPDGTVLYSETKVLPYSDFKCTTDELWGFNLASGRGATPGSKISVFPTGVSGLSFRINAQLGDGPGYLASLYTLKAGSYKLDGNLIMEIVKSGPLAPSAVVATGELGTIQYGSHQIP